MAEFSGIQWTTHTFNPWIGCTNVGPGCDFCYAEALDPRFGGGHWGAGAPRKRTSAHNWNEPMRWNRRAIKDGGIRPRVFCGSLMDWADNEIDPEWREDLWKVVRFCNQLSWMMLTKRIGNAAKMLPDPETWREHFGHVGIMATVVNQQEADRDIPKLLALKQSHGVSWVGLSCEPLLGPIDLQSDLRRYLDRGLVRPGFIDLVIVGGESGNKARPMHPDWARDIRDQCLRAGTPFFFKQWGQWECVYDRDQEDPDWRRCPEAKDENERYLNLAGGHGFHGERVVFMRKLRKKKHVALLDGREWNQLPPQLLETVKEMAA